MLSVRVKAGPALAFTQAAKKQVRFATAVAITRTLFDARKAATGRLEKDIDRPTPFTLRAYRVDKATKATLTGRLYAQPIQARYLQFQVFGGVRTPRGSALTIPPIKDLGDGVKLDRYGNLPRRSRARALLARPDTFSGKINGVAGIWQRPKKTKSGKARKGQRLRLLLAYSSKASYRKRLRFYEPAVETTDRHFRRHFDAAYRSALSSAI